MKILILGAGKMGKWITDALCLEHEVALYDKDPKNLRFIFNTMRITSLDEVRDFAPEILINAVSLQHTINAFKETLPFLPKSCIISDISSVKTGLKEFYRNSGFNYVSTHPMFGPTFANINNLSNQNAIIITESNGLGKAFFRDFFNSLHLNIYEYSFDEHDETIGYSLAIPFASTLVFGANMKKINAPGTTFKRHLDIARGLLSEDDYLLMEILFNPYSYDQIEQVRKELRHLMDLIKERDENGLKAFLAKVRGNIE